MRLFCFTLFFLSFLSCSALQYRTDLPVESQFVNFKSLGISKENLIKKYGNPISTGIFRNDDAISEILYYTENLKDYVITTEFTFTNNKLDSVKILKVEKNYQNQLEDIKWKTRINRH